MADIKVIKKEVPKLKAGKPHTLVLGDIDDYHQANINAYEKATKEKDRNPDDYLEMALEAQSLRELIRGD